MRLRSSPRRRRRDGVAVTKSGSGSAHPATAELRERESSPTATRARPTTTSHLARGQPLRRQPSPSNSALRKRQTTDPVAGDNSACARTESAIPDARKHPPSANSPRLFRHGLASAASSPARRPSRGGVSLRREAFDVSPSRAAAPERPEKSWSRRPSPRRRRALAFCPRSRSRDRWYRPRRPRSSSRNWYDPVAIRPLRRAT